jgi:hypothetical protein
MIRFLTIAAFGLASLWAGAGASAAPVPYGPHVVYGFVRGAAGDALVVQTRSGALARFDIRIARAAGRLGVLYPNRPVALHGEYDARRIYHVNAITTANQLRLGTAWPQDR